MFDRGPLQRRDLINTVERLHFWAAEDPGIQIAKNELLSQIKNLDMTISAKGFFTIDRHLLASVIFPEEILIQFDCVNVNGLFTVRRWIVHVLRHLHPVPIGCTRTLIYQMAKANNDTETSPVSFKHNRTFVTSLHSSH